MYPWRSSYLRNRLDRQSRSIGVHGYQHGNRRDGLQLVVQLERLDRIDRLGRECFLSIGPDHNFASANQEFCYRLCQVILGSYLRFYYGLKRQGIDRRDFPFVAPMQPYLSWYGFIFFLIVIFFSGYTVFLEGNWNTSDFFSY